MVYTQSEHSFYKLNKNFKNDMLQREYYSHLKQVNIDNLQVRKSIHPKKVVLSTCKLNKKHLKGFDFYDKGAWLSGLNRAQLGTKEEKIAYIIIDGIVYKLNTYTRILKKQHITYKVLENSLLVNIPTNKTTYTKHDIVITTKSHAEKIASSQVID